MVDRDPVHGIQRRVTGYHDVRMDGMSDLLMRARGCSVLDIGCNRGMVGFEFACNGATIVHGCDIWDHGIDIARNVFADIRSVKAQFEIVDLSKGPAALDVFRGQRYDVILFLAIFLKLSRVMRMDDLGVLIEHLGKRCNRYFAWRGAEETLGFMDSRLLSAGLRRRHTSMLSDDMGPCAVWVRVQ